MNSNQELYLEIKKIAVAHNIIIFDDFIGEKTFVWHIKKNSESLIMPAKNLDLSDRLNLIIKELKNKNLDNVFLLPKIRDIIEHGNIKMSVNHHENKSINKSEDICEICGKGLDSPSKKYSMLNVCQTCLRSQVRYDINYSDCRKETTGRYCIDCPSNIYKNCSVIKKTLNPEIDVNLSKSNMEHKFKSSRMNRLSSTRLLSNDNSFIR
ncbi:hypothetical protein KA977_05375 [Candidatus Dependentiae bacterium]|nr:hypothetical protein [Candidatus Dependentiae bacterium]